MHKPEASSGSIVVIVDIGDDSVEPDSRASWWVLNSASGNTESHLLLDTNIPAVTVDIIQLTVILS